MEKKNRIKSSQNSYLRNKSFRENLEKYSNVCDILVGCDRSRRDKELGNERRFGYKNYDWLKNKKKNKMRDLYSNPIKNQSFRAHQKVLNKLESNKRIFIIRNLNGKIHYDNDLTMERRKSQRFRKKRKQKSNQESFQIDQRRKMKENKFKLLKHKKLFKSKMHTSDNKPVYLRKDNQMFLDLKNLLKKRKKKLISKMSITNDKNYFIQKNCVQKLSTHLESDENNRTKGQIERRFTLNSKKRINKKSLSLNLKSYLKQNDSLTYKLSKNVNYNIHKKKKPIKTKLEINQVNITADFKSSQVLEKNCKKIYFPKKKISKRFQSKFYDIMILNRKSRDKQRKKFSSSFAKNTIKGKEKIKLKSSKRKNIKTAFPCYPDNQAFNLPLSLKRNYYSTENTRIRPKTKSKLFETFWMDINMYPISDLGFDFKTKKNHSKSYLSKLFCE
jgi:hypothetical protein